MIKPILLIAVVILAGCTALANKSEQPEKLRALIVDGQNNHKVWPKSTFMMKQMLEETGHFEVDIYRSANTWNAPPHIAAFPLNDGKVYVEGEPKTDASFFPNFSQYDVVISNFGWKAASWPDATKLAFEHYMRDGGGFVSIHAANNSFGDWHAYNQMIGLGGWGGRGKNSGPYVYYDNQDKLVTKSGDGRAGGHGKQHSFAIKTRSSDHPIMQGMPTTWMHTKDELYNRLRGPAENMTVLATAYDNPTFEGFGRHEPVLMAIEYQKGRIFQSTLGHDVPAYESVGFISTFQRGTEWAASGRVTIAIPADFPTETSVNRRPFSKKED